jgi:hypothetical protein
MSINPGVPGYLIRNFVGTTILSPLFKPGG